MRRPSATPRRFLHLWLPRLSTDRARLGAPTTTPLVLVAKVKGALRLQAVDEAAEAQGVQAAMTLADARVLVPGLEVREADPAADAACLDRLALAHRRYTPALALAAPDGLDLDVTGAAALVGDEDRLSRSVLSRLATLGFAGRLGLADTPGLAYALARFSRDAEARPVVERSVIAPAGVRAAALAPLPVEALRPPPEDSLVLARLGLRRVGQLLEMPRAALVRRFGSDLVKSLDEALGLSASPLHLHLAPPRFLTEQRLLDPVATQEGVLRVLGRLAHRLTLDLETRGLGGRRFRLELFRVDGAVRRVEVATIQSTRAPGRITALFAERLAGLDEGLEADFGFDVFRLSALQTQATTVQSASLLEDARAAPAFAMLVDRIAARDGLQVDRLVPTDAHRPRSSDRTSCADGEGPAEAWTRESPAVFEGAPLRPLRLFAAPQPIDEVVAEVPEGPPARFRWRRLWRRVSCAEGPERFGSSFDPAAASNPAVPDPAVPDPAVPDPAAQDRPGIQTRDYYRLEDEQGRRYWVFRQGLYGAPQPPAWFLHGLFG